MADATDTIRLLCMADLHLGRHPSRVPVGEEGLSVSEVWGRAVRLAVSREVDAVLLAGDVVDRENRYYEAFGPLQEGVRRLVDRGIEVVAVGGNHDWDVLPRLAETIGHERLHLLGRGGRWESVTLESGEAAVEVCGWSFPSEHYPASPLAEAAFETAGDVPSVGLLHADLGASEAKYAPVTRRELEEAAPRHWVLGHLHAPAEHELAGGMALYPGSLQPLDPGETGVHGGSMLRISADGSASVTREPLATLRYSEQTVDIGEVGSREDFERLVPAELEEYHRRLVEETPGLERIVYRLELVGRTPVHRHVEAWSELLVDDLSLRFDGTLGGVDEVSVATRPTYDLEALARSDDPPGVLAQVIRQLESGEPTDEIGELVGALRRRLVDDVYQTNAYAPLRADESTAGKPAGEEVREMLIRQGWLLLDELMEQKNA